MHSSEVDQACFWFFRPFFEDRRGHILGLATATENLRDGLAATRVSRLFPVLDYPDIVVGPSRPTIQPEDNLILIGSSFLFLRSDAHGNRGKEPPLAVGEANLGPRLRRIHDDCCFRLTLEGDRSIVNEVTGKRYTPKKRTREGLELDYGVIRRAYRSPTENTILLDGLRMLSTLGTSKLITSPEYLVKIRRAVQKLEHSDDAAPLEILVQSTFQPRPNHGVYAVETIKAVPLALVYNRRWICDLTEQLEWRDQLPWNLCLKANGTRPVGAAAAANGDSRPRLALKFDLREQGPAAVRLCEQLQAVARGQAPAVETDLLDPLFDLLAAESDRCLLELEYKTSFARSTRRISLPEGDTKVRRLRKRFLVLLALCRLLGRSFPCDRDFLRRFFPDFEGTRSTKSEVEQFMGRVRGRMSEGFEPLFGATGRRKKNFVQIDYTRRTKTYDLRLDRAALELKLRW